MNGVLRVWGGSARQVQSNVTTRAKPASVCSSPRLSSLDYRLSTTSPTLVFPPNSRLSTINSRLTLQLSTDSSTLDCFPPVAFIHALPHNLGLMKSRALKIGQFVVRWVIAIVGVAWVISQIELHDRVLVLYDRNLPAETRLTTSADEDATTFNITDPATGKDLTVGRERVVNGPDVKTIAVALDNQPARPHRLLGMRLRGDLNHNPVVDQLLIQTTAPDGKPAGVWIAPNAVAGGYKLSSPRPRVDPGIISLLAGASHLLLILAVLVFPVTYVFTTWRWHRLLDALQIPLRFSRTLTLNMVGAFYNTFMPGSTGGDVLKAYYVVKHAPQRRTSAVMSVIIDRILGLLTLIMIGGVMAAARFAVHPRMDDPTSAECLKVAVVSVVGLSCALAGMFILLRPALRRALGVNWLLRRAPMQDKLEKLIDVARVYRARPGLILWALVITIPVHLAVVLSALLAGMAFNLPISIGYYFVVVPVLVLVASLPISPQGVGVMEAMAFLMLQKQGVTVGQTLALTMSIRMVQIIWNLTGGIFVLRGGYHAPTDAEQQTLEADLITPTSASTLAAET